MKNFKHFIWNLLIPDDISLIIRERKSGRRSNKEFDKLVKEMDALQKSLAQKDKDLKNANRLAHNWQDVTRELVVDQTLRWLITCEVNKRQAENNSA